MNRNACHAWAPLLLLLSPVTGGCNGHDGPATKHEADGRDGLPQDYVLVGSTGAGVFTSFPPTGIPAARVGPGFGFAVTERRAHAGTRYVHLHDGRWLAEADVTPAQPSAFTGVTLALGDALQFAWVIAAQTTVRTDPRDSAAALAVRPFRSRLLFKGPCQAGWCPLTPGWVRAGDLAIPVRSMAPQEAGGPATRWMDIDLASQVLVAYQGPRPVYATLISGGIGQPGSPFATPTGVFPIRSKHVLIRMDNLEHTGVIPYAYDVPLAQYLTDGKALHAALWHDRFGRPTSHGCVNLSPRDAAWLYRFTAPQVANTAPETRPRPGTVVRIHGTLPKIVPIVDLGP